MAVLNPEYNVVRDLYFQNIIVCNEVDVGHNNKYGLYTTFLRI